MLISEAQLPDKLQSLLKKLEEPSLVVKVPEKPIMARERKKKKWRQQIGSCLTTQNRTLNLPTSLLGIVKDERGRLLKITLNVPLGIVKNGRTHDS
jgi:hypothetical protein